MSQRAKIVVAFLAGFSAVYILKYGVFGLQAWDSLLHPNRLIADTAGPNKSFTKPLLGIFG